MVKNHSAKLLLGVLCVVGFALLPKKSKATGFVKIESNGFMRRSTERADSSSTISAGPDLKSDGKTIETKLDLQAIVQITDTKNLKVDRSAFTLEAANGYVATSKKLMPHHQVTLGRRVYDWAKFDDSWQFGTYSPRFIWDPIRPQTIGLTGLFYTYQSRNWRMMAYGSPINIPERGYPLRNENGQLLSSSAFNVPYPTTAVIAKQNIPMVYNVDMPPINELVLNPGAVTSVRYNRNENGKGFWAQGLYGNLPVHQVNLAINAKYSAQGGVIDVRIHPAIQRHQLFTLESGFQYDNFSFWASATEEVPMVRNVPTDWIATRSEPATLLSTGGEINLGRRWKVNGSYLHVNEALTPVTDNNNFTVDLGGRFQYHRAAKGNLFFQGSERMTYILGLLADIEKESQLASFDINYVILKRDTALTLNLGSDFFASATGKGYIGQYQGNDRFRGGVSYAF